MDGTLQKKDHEQTGEFSYDGCCRATLSKDGFGQLDYKMGHAGAGVVFSTGGDGCFKVYGLKDDDGMITKIRIDID